MQEYATRSTTLDRVLRIVFPALSEGGRRDLPTMVPSRIAKLWMSASGPSNSKGFALRAYAHSHFNGNRGIMSSVAAMSADANEPRIVIDGYEMTFVTSLLQPMSTKSGSRQLCYAMDWKPDIDLMTNEQVSQFCEQTRPEV